MNAEDFQIEIPEGDMLQIIFDHQRDLIDKYHRYRDSVSHSIPSAPFPGRETVEGQKNLLRKWDHQPTTTRVWKHAGTLNVQDNALQVPATWHWSEAVHVTWLPAVQVPDWHVSFRSQEFPSLHDAPLATFVYAVVLTDGWHVSQVFVPFAAPAGTHAPPIAQKPAFERRRRAGAGARGACSRGVARVGSRARHVTACGTGPRLARVVQVARIAVAARSAVGDVRVRGRAYGRLAGLARVRAICRARRNACAAIEQNPALSVGAEQAPVLAVHVPAVWHASGGCARHVATRRAGARLARFVQIARVPVVARGAVGRRRGRALSRRRIARPGDVALV